MRRRRGCRGAHSAAALEVVACPLCSEYDNKVDMARLTEKGSEAILRSFEEIPGLTSENFVASFRSGLTWIHPQCRIGLYNKSRAGNRGDLLMK